MMVGQHDIYWALLQPVANVTGGRFSTLPRLWVSAADWLGSRQDPPTPKQRHRIGWALPKTHPTRRKVGLRHWLGFT